MKIFKNPNYDFVRWTWPALVLSWVIILAGGLYIWKNGIPKGVEFSGGTNLILVAFLFVTVHLQHSHVWIASTGVLGRVILSPAHHQIHHSDNPVHFDKNLGSSLAIWDWLFGTLYVPKKEPENVSFGVAPHHPDAHSLPYTLFDPVRRVAAQLSAWLRRAPAAAPVEPQQGS